MNKRAAYFAAAALVAATLSGGAGCAQASLTNGVDEHEGKAEARLFLNTVHPYLAGALAGASAQADASSRAFMFLDKVYISVYDYDAYTYVFNEYVELDSTDPGSVSPSPITLYLEQGHRFWINVNGYNPTQPDNAVVYGSSDYDPFYQGNSVKISLFPNEPIAIYNGSTPSTTILSSHYDMSLGANGEFVTLGGESWFSLYSSSGEETVTINATPDVDSVYMALYDSNGRFVSGGLSGNFGAPGSPTATVYSGLSPYTYYYLGVVAVSADTARNVTINLSVATGNGDDQYEPNDSYADYTLVPDSPISALALDKDWYQFQAPADGNYTFVAESAAAVTGALQVYDTAMQYTVAGGNDENWNEGPASATPKTSYSVSPYLYAGNWYYVSVDFQASAPEYGFPMVGGPYTLTLVPGIVQSSESVVFEGNTYASTLPVWSVDPSIYFTAFPEGSLRSPAIVDSEIASITRIISVPAGSVLSEVSFWYKVSSEEGYDYLKFYIDGELQSQWSGEIDWSQASFYPALSGPGDHLLKWVYSKDYMDSLGLDCTWIDDIVIGIGPAS